MHVNDFRRAHIKILYRQAHGDVSLSVGLVVAIGVKECMPALVAQIVVFVWGWTPVTLNTNPDFATALTIFGHWNLLSFASLVKSYKL